MELEDDRILLISDERKIELEDKGDKWHRIERNSESFMRRYMLSENAKMDQLKGSMENEVLTV